jgi:nicotinamidase-related amidase
MPEKVFIRGKETELVVIDMQKDFCCADGALFVCD